MDTAWDRGWISSGGMGQMSAPGVGSAPKKPSGKSKVPIFAGICQWIWAFLLHAKHVKRAASILNDVWNLAWEGMSTTKMLAAHWNVESFAFEKSIEGCNGNDMAGGRSVFKKVAVLQLRFRQCVVVNTGVLVHPTTFDERFVGTSSVDSCIWWSL